MIRVNSARTHFGFSSGYEPVAQVKPGDDVVFEVVDQYRLGEKSFDHYMKKPLIHNQFEINWSKVNPVSGPVFVKGAQPGDVLKVVIRNLELDDFGVYNVVPGCGVLGDIVENPWRKLVPVREGKAIFSKDVRIPWTPNIGTIGVAPAKGMIPSILPGDHGGNIDTKEVREGATLYLPIFVSGALFGLGDLHICMGDGELMGGGGGTGGRVQVNLSLVHGKSLSRPLLNAERGWFTIASGKTLDEAVEKANVDMVALLQSALELSFNEAYLLLGMACDARISQVVNPLKTVRVRAPEYLFQRDPPI